MCFWGHHDSSLTVTVWVVMAADTQGSFLIEHYSFVWHKWMHIYLLHVWAIKAEDTPILVINPLGDVWLRTVESSDNNSMLLPLRELPRPPCLMVFHDCHFLPSLCMCFIDDRLVWREEHQFGCCLPFKQPVAEAGCQGGASTCVCRKRQVCWEKKGRRKTDRQRERASERSESS